MTTPPSAFTVNIPQPSLGQRLLPLRRLRRPRNVIVHYHIFKNAGTTIDAILRRNFPRACGAVESSRLSGRLNRRDLLRYVLANPGLKAVSSHQARLPAPRYPGLRFFSILFIRHPIDRIGSVYAFDRRQPQLTTPGIRLAHELSFQDYVRAILDSESSVTLSNFQCVWLSGRVDEFRSTRATDHDFARARKRLAALPFVGLVESFDKSLVVLQDYLSPGFGVLDLSYAVQNKSEDRRASLKERLEDAEAQLGPALYLELLEKNALDLALYEMAVGLFEGRYADFLHRGPRMPADVTQTVPPGSHSASEISLKGIRHHLALAFPTRTLRGRIVRALNGWRLSIQVQAPRVLDKIRNGISLTVNSGVPSAAWRAPHRIRSVAEEPSPSASLAAGDRSDVRSHRSSPRQNEGFDKGVVYDDDHALF